MGSLRKENPGSQVGAPFTMEQHQTEDLSSLIKKMSK